MEKLFFYDLETTGTKFWKNGIHQISGAIVIDGEIKDFSYFSWTSSSFNILEYSSLKDSIVISSLLFFLGVLFGYFILTPLSLNFLSTFTVSDVIKNDINVNSYIGTVKTTTLATGLVFELPIIIYFLSTLGLVTPSFLREYRKWAYVIILIIAAIVTPPDVISQVIVTIPLIILYEISIFISAFIFKKNNKSITTI